jgi:transcriptional regulator with XRE-family HTH domain
MREESGLTQVQLASKIDVSQSHYSKYERGELRLDIVQLRAICIASGTSLAKFAKRLEDDLPKGR